MKNNFSLLYPEGKKPAYITLGDDACNDLSIDFLCESITDSEYEKNIIKRMLCRLESDPDVIRYRRDVFEDILRFPALRERIKDLLEQMDFLKELEKSVKDRSAAPVWQLINRLHELDIYVNCISGINEILTDNDIKSAGLKKLKDFVSNVYSESGFDALQKDISEMVTEAGRIKSLTIGINLDHFMRPVDIGIMSINDEQFEKPGILGKFMDFALKKSEIQHGTSFSGLTKIHTVARVAGDDPLLGGLSTVMEEMLKSTVKQIKDRLQHYVGISGYGLTTLIPELLFYIRWAEYFEKLMKTGIPLCKPEIIDPQKREMHIKGMYNIKLAMKDNGQSVPDIIRNDIDFTLEHGIYILTGPNRGGKTTFTQAVGILALMAQHGLYVPAEEAVISPVDNIYTHFPADENQTVDLGRLGEESKRLSEIFAQATDRSLLLFNESLATTSFAEGLYIAKDVVKALHFLGARTIYNTHMHELAMHPEEMNSLEGDMNVASLITGIHEGKRSYKVFLAPPEGISYAKDIAEKYGVTYDLLKTTIKRSGAQA